MKKTLSILLLIISCYHNSYSQCNSQLVGYVLNENRDTLSNALVTILHKNELYTMTLTNSNGYFEVNGVESDKVEAYNMYASYAGYETESNTRVLLSCNKNTMVIFRLELKGKPKDEKLYNTCYLFAPEEKTHKRGKSKH